jgi:type IV secretory pathway TraG/TraD family ATPase VirD4
VAVGDFLRNLSDSLGDYDKRTASVSSGDGRRQISEQLRRERILDPADLAAFPRGRAVVLASGCRPTLVKTEPWMTKPYAGAVKQSLAAWTPKGDITRPDGPAGQAGPAVSAVQASPAGPAGNSGGVESVPAAAGGLREER